MQQITNRLDENLTVRDVKVLIKGAGEMASGIAHRLFMANFRHIVMTEIAEPVTVRRTVAFSEAVYTGRMGVEGVQARLVLSPEECVSAWKASEIAVLVDPQWIFTRDIDPEVVVDATMMKRYTGTRKDEASLVIGVGPGFTAPKDVHAVVESNRGHDLGRVILKGSAEPKTGIPAVTMGYTTERVLRAAHGGLVRHVRTIGDMVKKGDLVLYINETPVHATIDGMLRGLIREIEVPINKKIGDIDPRGIAHYCCTITEKARAIGGGVLEAMMHFLNR